MLVTGAAGQIGFYLVHALAAKGYKVYAMVRDKSKIDAADYPYNVVFIETDITDPHFIDQVRALRPDYVYNMAGFSHIGRSFEQPEMVMETNVVPVIRLLQVCKECNIKLIQASSYEVFAGAGKGVVNESSPISPVSPYSIAKSTADQYIKLARKNGTWAMSLYLGNAESSRRPTSFVTAKIVKYFKEGQFDTPLRLGYIDAMRDWGYAPHYAKIMADLPVHISTPEDLVLATGIGHTVRTFIKLVAEHFGYKVVWEGDGVNEHGTIITQDYFRVADIRIDSDLYRPTDVPRLIGSNAKIKALGLHPDAVSLRETVKHMVENRHVYTEN